jgi:LPXTG-motif cell wall-anchored protein
MSRTRTLLTAVSAFALAGGLVLASGTVAVAYPDEPADLNIVMFSNGLITDPGQEDLGVHGALTGLGGTLTIFDGGDGSALAWSTALTDVDLLVLPEPERGPHYVAGGSVTMSDDAADVLRDWISDGGYVIAMGAWDDYFYGPLLSALTGLDYNAATAVVERWGEPIVLQGSVPGAPAELPHADGSYLFADFGAWSAELLAPVTPIYLSGDGQALGVGSWTIGDGIFLYVAYDWFPGNTAENLAIWDDFLQFAAAGAFAPADAIVEPGPEPEPEPEPAAVPELAETGRDSATSAILALGALALGAALVVARRRGASARR